MNFTWSFSSLKDYVNCPRQYQEIKVLKRFTKFPTEQMIYGTQVHKACEDYVGEGKGTCGWENNYIRYGFKDILADLPNFIDRVSKHLKGNDDQLNFRFFTGFDTIFPYDDPNKATKWIRSNDCRYSRLINIKEIVVSYLENNQRQELEAILTEYLKGVYIDGFMHMTRKSWIPGAHEGSQSQEHHGYRVLISAMEQALDTERKEYEGNNE